ncbi:hypothetical protein D3C71_1481890 [compost metagenome]
MHTIDQARRAHAARAALHIAKRRQRVHARHRIVFAHAIQARMHGFPIAFQGVDGQRQPVCVTRQAADLGPGTGQQADHAQVSRAFKQRAGQAFDLAPVRRLRGDDGRAELLFVPAGRGSLQLQEVSVVFKVFPAGQT